jgi:C1A family cysteine protease
MKLYKKTFFLLILLVEFLCFFMGTCLSVRAEIVPFEPGDTLEEIRAKIEHNGYKFTVKSNWVFDMPAQEKRKFLSRTAPLVPNAASIHDGIGPLVNHLDKRQLPGSFDWRNYNGRSYIGPIRDQGNCGACYAFGACAAAEGAYNWANGKYDSNCADFSEAFVAFCLSDHYSGFDGCAGSDYDYDELTGLVTYGVCNNSVYPYTDNEQSCRSSSWDAPRTTIESWHRVGCNNIEAIKTAMMTYGVIDAAVYVVSAFTAYSGGIYQDSNTSCGSNPCYYTPTNHIIALVGWNDNGGDGYWILRNSWGTSWGESGYMRIKYNSARVACEACYLVMGSTPSTTTTTTSTTTSTTNTTTSTTASTTSTSATTTTFPPLAQCPECSQSPVVLTNTTFNSDTACECSDNASITIGSGVSVKRGATVRFKVR